MVGVFADPMKAYPIRIATDALGESLPAHGLYLSPDHASSSTTRWCRPARW